MSEGYYGEIRIFGGNYAPAKWSFCYGTILAISSNTALFSLIGTTYGGDGRTSFGLPDLRGRIPLHSGQGPGLSNRNIGQRFGQEEVTLTINTMPAHTHRLQATNNAGNTDTPVGHLLSNGTTLTGEMYKDLNAGVATSATMATNQVHTAGDGDAHPNMMPWLGLNFIICLQGLFPSRS